MHKLRHLAEKVIEERKKKKKKKTTTRRTRRRISKKQTRFDSRALESFYPRESPLTRTSISAYYLLSETLCSLDIVLLLARTLLPSPPSRPVRSAAASCSPPAIPASFSARESVCGVLDHSGPRLGLRQTSGFSTAREESSHDLFSLRYEPASAKSKA